MKDIKLIIGLGNPGEEYKNTYHNVGVQALEFLIQKSSGEAKMKDTPLFSYTKAGEKIFIIPKTFMNESGEAVFAALKFFDCNHESLLVIHDDSDLQIGKWKIAPKQGSAGHHGVESIQKVMGTEYFWRARIGIRPEEKEGIPRKKAGDFVLRKIAKMDYETLQGVFEGLSEKLTEKVTP